MVEALARLASHSDRSAVDQIAGEDGATAYLTRALAHSRSGTLKLRAAQCLMLLGHLSGPDEVSAACSAEALLAPYRAASY